MKSLKMLFLVCPMVLLVSLLGCSPIQQTSDSASGLSVTGTVLSLKNQLQSSSSSDNSSYNVKLYKVNSKGQPNGEPISESTTDANGTFSLNLTSALNSSAVEYLVVASKTGSSELFEAFVVGQNLEIQEASTASVMATRIVAAVDSSMLSQLTHEHLMEMESVAKSILKDSTFSNFSEAYSQVIGATTFKSAISKGLSVDLSHIDFTYIPPQLFGVIVEKNGLITNERNFKPGDQITIRVFARDPKDLDLEYGFYLFRNCGLDSNLATWSSSSELSYTFQDADITSCTSIAIGIRNNDGHNFEGNLFGDLQFGVNLTVRDQRAPPVINSVESYKNGQRIDGGSYSPGDIIKLVANATDPNGLPLKYQFKLFRNCGLQAVVLPWSNDNQMSYTFQEADITSCTLFVIEVKNNDGLDIGGAFSGDVQTNFSVSVRDQRVPPVVTSITKYKNGVLYAGDDFAAGDSIRIVVNASDPNNLPLQYKFELFRNCGLEANVQPWSSVNEATYTLQTADITSCTSMVIGVKNNDGLDFDGFFGDLQYPVRLSVH